jgi:glycosyltransferase involved in cell wall biosynthesis
MLRIGFTGQVAPHKGGHLLVKAFKLLRPATQPIELHIHGGLEARPDYVARLRQIAGNDPRIHFHGRFDNRRVGAILAGLDVTVVPSIWYENSPLAIHESHASGTPVITAALGGMAELVRDDVDGLHFQPNDADDLARQMQRLIDEPTLLARLRAGIPKPWSIDDEMQRMTGIYQNAIAAQPAALQEVA